MTVDEFIKGFVIPAETVYEKGHYGDPDHAITEHDPDDPGNFLGGRNLGTKWGIDCRSYGKDPSSITLVQAVAIYKRDYYDKCSCQRFSEPMNYAYMDVCINSGQGRADQLNSVANGDARKFLKVRDAFYRRLAENRPKSAKYLKGWLNRDQELRNYLHIN